MKISLFGSLPPPIGGTTVSFLELINALERDGTNPLVVNLSNYKSVLPIPNLLAETVRVIKKSDVVTFHIAIGSLVYISIPARVLCFLLGKPYIIRRFGGQCISDLGWVKTGLLRLFYKGAAAVLCQTHSQLREAERICRHASWFPTARPGIPEVRPKSNPVKRFVYIGQIKRDKGVFELLDSFASLRSSYPEVQLDYYGPLYDGISADQLNQHGASYHGVLEPDQVCNVLIKADVMVLPTYYFGEGYPGVIIESLMTATPVITTRWKAIPEIVDESSAILIEPRSQEALYQAMLTLTQDLTYANKLRRGALEKSANYTIENQKQLFLESCLIASESNS